jgi:hypothetical protein
MLETKITKVTKKGKNLTVLFSILKFLNLYVYRSDNLRRPNAIPEGVGGTD